MRNRGSVCVSWDIFTLHGCHCPNAMQYLVWLSAHCSALSSESSCKQEELFSESSCKQEELCLESSCKQEKLSSKSSCKQEELSSESSFKQEESHFNRSSSVLLLFWSSRFVLLLSVCFDLFYLISLSAQESVSLPRRGSTIILPGSNQMSAVVDFSTEISRDFAMRQVGR